MKNMFAAQGRPAFLAYLLPVIRRTADSWLYEYEFDNNGILESRHVGSCELPVPVSASDSGMARSRCLNKPRRLPRFSALTSSSLAFRPLVSIPYGNHDRDGRPAHHEPFTFHEGGPVPGKLRAIFRVSVAAHIFSPVLEKPSACFYSVRSLSLTGRKTYFIITFLLHHNALSFNNEPPTVFPVTTIPEIKLEDMLFSLLSSNTSDPILAKL